MKIHKRVHFIGIGGVSMSGLAQILLQGGTEVTGSDRVSSDVIQRLLELGAKVSIGHDAKNVEGASLVVYTAAIAQDNVELVAARQAGIECVERAVFLGEFMKEYTVPIAVSGTHGKTTTTSMLACILIEAELDPTVMVGGELAAIGGNLRIGSKKTLVFEACEYVDSFLNFNPMVAVVLNIEADHLDYFKDIEHIKQSFVKFLKKIPEDGFCVLNMAEESVRDVAGQVEARIVSYGGTDCDYWAEDVQGSRFVVCRCGEKVAELSLRVPGAHNVSNALAAFAAADSMGIPVETIVRGLEGFTGTGRRFEFKGMLNGARVYDDYAHHPTEVRATLEAALSLPHNKVWCVFQPHTYTRTRALGDKFVEALSVVDKVILTPIYAARENPIEGVSAANIAAGIDGAVYMEDMGEIAECLRKNVAEGDIVITMGAGDIYKINEKLKMENE